MRLPEELINELAYEGGRFVLTCTPDKGWMAACEWGSGDFPMAGTAAYGVGGTADEAMDAVLADMGIR